MSLILLSSHKSGSAGAMSKLAPVARRPRRRAPHSGTTTANGFDSRSPVGDRAREHRELNRRDNPRHRSGKRGSQHCSDPPPPPWNGKRKPGRVHAWGRGAQCRFGKAPPSRSDRGPQGPRERVGRGSLLERRRQQGVVGVVVGVCDSLGVSLCLAVESGQPDRTGPVDEVYDATDTLL